MLAKDAFNSVCEKIAERYQESGWKYAKSSHWMTKKDKNFTFKVFFYTSWYNVSDVSVTFYGDFWIGSKNGKQGYFGLSTMNCNVPKDGLHWNVAKKEMWDEAIEEFTNWFETECIPIMNECTNNLDEYVKKVAEEGFYPKHGYKTSLEFITQFGSKELAEIATRKHYDNLGRLGQIEFKRNYDSMINGGEPVSRWGMYDTNRRTAFQIVIENKLMVDLPDRSLKDKSGMFEDFSFKLVVINSLLNKKSSFSDELEEMKAKYVETQQLAGVIPKMLEYFENLRLTEDDLALVEELSFDEKEEIYILVRKCWRDSHTNDDHVFSVTSVKEFEMLPNLKKVKHMTINGGDVWKMSMHKKELMKEFENKGIEVLYEERY